MASKNLLSEIMPELRLEWDEETNSEMRVSFDAITSGSNKKVSWICKNGHRWEATAHNRSKGTGCPYCAGLIPVSGVNDLATTNPELIEEWDYDKNTNVEPNKLLAKSNKKVWWKCSKGHSWEAVIASRTIGTGCPFCANRKLLKGFNDLATTNPELLKEWNYEKNNELGVVPEETLASSIKPVWWTCSSGHEWKVAIRYRAIQGTCCPICSGNIVKVGFNDLATTNPELMEEWDFEKNNIIGITPNNISKGSEKKVWWQCSKCGYEWSSLIKNRIKGSGCPRCSKIQHSSMPEQSIFFYIRKFFPDAVNSYRPDYLNGQELDVFIPSLNIGIEYDGRAWHKNNKRDDDKNKKVTRNGVRLIRVREPGCADLKPIDNVFIINTSEPTVDATFLDSAIKELLELLSLFSKRIINGNVSIKNDYYSILSEYQTGIKEKSIPIVKAELLKEWDFDKNKVNPESVSSMSGRKFWWKCSKGHEWLAPVYNRVNGSGCPFCSNQKVLAGFNDLVSTNPELIKEWNYDKNSVAPTAIIAGTNKKVWWKCSKGHEWKANVASRAKGNGTKCPYCSGLLPIEGETDLVTTNPELVKEWDFEKNEQLGITPQTVSRASAKKVWWKCSYGHEWQASINNRAKSKGTSCPYCSGHKVLAGFNDLATTNPALVREWDFNKNEQLGITPESVSKGSTKKAWWLCSKGHSWYAEIGSRTNGNNCPFCSGHKVLSGFNDLATTNLANVCQASFSISVYKKDVSKQMTAVADPSEKYNNVARSIYRVP